MFKSKQEILDLVAERLFETKKKSVLPDSDGDESQCQYLSPEGDKCAIGLLIPKGKYKKRFDLESVHPLEVLYHVGLLPAKNDNEMRSFLGDLQRCHDTCLSTEGEPFWKEFSDNVRVTCKRFKLEAPSNLAPEES